MPKHHPRHYYLNDAVYFVTAHIYKSKRYLDTDEKKSLLIKSFQAALADNEYQLYVWVVLENHYHLMFKTRIGDKLPQLIKQIHVNCLEQLNELENKKRKVVFYNYWDTYIRDKKKFYTHFNYTHYNPVKHSYVKKITDYPFSSYEFWLNKKGEDWLNLQFHRFPIVDFSLGKEDAFDNA